MRVAVKVGYDGTKFHGSQVQPGVRTVHGELAQALREMGHPEPHVLWAGRTDAGVSAAGNVAVFETHVMPASLLPGLSHRMEDAWAWAWTEVGAEFEPRVARRRRYRYLLRTGAPAERVAEALAVFEGTHDFTHFCKLEEGVDPRRTVFATRARRDGPHVVIDVEGESFLWNQVRRMVAAAERIAEGRAERKEVEILLAKGAQAPPQAHSGGFGTADPEPLMLVDVEYAGLAFERAADPARALLRLARRETEAERALAMLRAMREAAEGERG
ncbi:MAG TPA: tRNA pseudouridine(38-40) synthase TruA [Candidatus Thermoplasmatota archaeon]|nr:tRNA pseudouridine(38-40) synthase TruA [Candidatus Thermoplasmatota archaeon]